MDQLLKISLFGQTYTFKTDTTDAQAEAVAVALTEEVERLSGGQAGAVTEMSKLTLMILAALNFANENYELRAAQGVGQKNLSQRAARLVQILDGALAKRGGIGLPVNHTGPAPYTVY